jgi:hypothetical protein
MTAAAFQSLGISGDTKERLNRLVIGVATISVDGIGQAVHQQEKYVVTELDNGFWVLGLHYIGYQVSTSPSICLHPREKPKKVGVFVDYEEGKV